MSRSAQPFTAFVPVWERAFPTDGVAAIDKDLEACVRRSRAQEFRALSQSIGRHAIAFAAAALITGATAAGLLGLYWLKSELGIDLMHGHSSLHAIVYG